MVPFAGASALVAPFVRVGQAAEFGNRGSLTLLKRPKPGQADRRALIVRIWIDPTYFFERYYQTMREAGASWRQHEKHGKLLDDFEDIGGLEACPATARADIVRWLVQLYIGEPGGYGQGINRSVFYSNVGAPRAERIIAASGQEIAEEVESAAKSKLVKAQAANKHVARRLEMLRDLVSA